MGNASDGNSVVDPELKLKGFKNIRVADASVMPNIPAGNIMCPTYAIGQKAAEMILAEWA